MAVGGLINVIFSIFGNDIDVTISPDIVHFKCNGRTESHAPIIYVSPDTHQVLAVGTAQVPALHIRVELFGTGGSAQANLSKQDGLAMFFRYAFSRLLKRWIFIRPRVVVHGSNSLGPILCGYHEGILREAIEKAGARECHFKS